MPDDRIDLHQEGGNPDPPDPAAPAAPASGVAQKDTAQRTGPPSEPRARSSLRERFRLARSPVALIRDRFDGMAPVSRFGFLTAGVALAAVLPVLMPHITRMSVVLPLPLAPTMATDSPSPKLRLTSLSATMRPLSKSWPT